MQSGPRTYDKVLLNGDMYQGNFIGMLPHGKGIYTWADGTSYIGDWEESRMTGKGHIIWASGAEYKGDFSGGYLHGFGILTGPNGSSYTGAWMMNVQHGIGRKHYYNSDIYEGSWKNGVREGNGRYHWHNGNTYAGNWKSGKMCGKGAMKWVNGDIFNGFWSNGFRHGLGVYRFADGAYYIGIWTNGLKDGKGTYFPNSIGLDDKEKAVLPHCASLNPQECGIPKFSFKKVSISGVLRNYGCISHKTTTSDEKCSSSASAIEFLDSDESCVLSNTSDEGWNEMQDNNTPFVDKTTFYEREYMQGVLVKEKVGKNVESSFQSRDKKKLHNEVKTQCFRDILKGRHGHYMMLSLQLGIRYTVGKITPVPMREVRSSDFGDEARTNIYFPRKGSQLTPPHHSIDFYWKDYCSIVFRNLRDLFKLDVSDYMMSISGNNGLKELSSPGKSGSFFYLSHDDRFVIKTMKKSELKVLLRMLPSYYDHVQNYENTLITKFFGLHRIKLRGGRKVRFMVMGNIFYTDLRIHHRYDLKGSTHGRYTEKYKIDYNTTLKDQDLSYEFHMDKSLWASLFEQLALDCKFLESQEIIDYSLLLGLHSRAPEPLKAFLEPPNTVHDHECSTSGDGVSSRWEFLIPAKGLLLVTHEPSSFSTMSSPHIRGRPLRAFSVGDEEVDLFLPETGRLRVQLGVNMPAQARHKPIQDGADCSEFDLLEVYDVVLYLGIIDILQEYNMKKRMEHACKSFWLDPTSISAVEPKLYSNRFVKFLESVFHNQP